MPEHAIYRFPEFYKELWLLCVRGMLDLDANNKLFQLLLVLPRGHAKTTFVKLFVAYGLVHGLFDFCLILCASDSNAAAFASDVSQMLSHTNVTTLYGDWRAGIIEDNSVVTRARFMGRTVQLKTTSIGSGKVRGTQRDMQRPDFILFDDVQTKKVAESEELSKQLAGDIVGTAMKARSPHRCGIIYLANSYPRNCIADKLSQPGTGFITLRTGAILADGTALWEDLHPLAQLREEFARDIALGQEATFMAEVMNQPLEREGRAPLFPSGHIPLTLVDPSSRKLGAFVTIDPAGRKKGSDDTAITGHIIWEGYKFDIVEQHAEILDPKQTIQLAVAMAARIAAPIIYVEAVAYQESLAFWGQETLATLHLQHTMRFEPLTVGQGSKLARIRAWAGEMQSGMYGISNREVRDALLLEAYAFDPTRTDNTDNRLDSCAMGTIVRNKCLQSVLAAYSNYTPPAKAPPVVHGALGKIHRIHTGVYTHG